MSEVAGVDGPGYAGGGVLMSEYSAWFECINGCPTRFSLFEVIYRCPSCGGRLLHRCPACSAPFSSTFAVDCEECGAQLRAPELQGLRIRKLGK